uniref:TIR domain-containing protein n=1 Tax=Entomoneis paludosa TaxID=265537 RepID=A0A7S2VCQ7_9STRA|mmetsp:Transcript_1721/g.3659  ORF Transcript_1721/g.3659 Transcript_1721/m.3659 type:complete len:883 (+) Transcript_1721:237-2885(+)
MGRKNLFGGGRPTKPQQQRRDIDSAVSFFSNRSMSSISDDATSTSVVNASSSTSGVMMMNHSAGAGGNLLFPSSSSPRPNPSSKSSVQSSSSSTSSSKQAFRLLEQQAERDDAAAQWEVGVKYLYGDRFVTILSEETANTGAYVPRKQDPSAGMAWLERAAEQGHLQAQFTLAHEFFTGEERVDDQKNGGSGRTKSQPKKQQTKKTTTIPRDYPKAVHWYRQAAEQGHGGAAYNLAGCYEHGCGVLPNLTIALEWCQRAATECQHEPSIAKIPQLQRQIKTQQQENELTNTPVDPVTAAKAAEHYQVGLDAWHGHNGQPPDLRVALQWIHAAASSHHALAQCTLGDNYQRGFLWEPPHLRVAMEWFQRASRQGLVLAHGKLAVCHETLATNMTRTTAQEDPTANTDEEESSTQETRMDHLRQALALYQKTAEESSGDAATKTTALEQVTRLEGLIRQEKEHCKKPHTTESVEEGNLQEVGENDSPQSIMPPLKVAPSATPAFLDTGNLAVGDIPPEMSTGSMPMEPIGAAFTLQESTQVVEIPTETSNRKPGNEAGKDKAQDQDNLRMKEATRVGMASDFDKKNNEEFSRNLSPTFSSTHAESLDEAPFSPVNRNHHNDTEGWSVPEEVPQQEPPAMPKPQRIASPFRDMSWSSASTSRLPQLPPSPDEQPPISSLYDVFLIHTGKEKLSEVATMKHMLEQQKFRCFLDSETIAKPKHPQQTMECALESCRHAVAIISRAFLTKSSPCAELHYAFDRMKWLRSRKLWDSLWIVFYDLTVDDYKTVRKAHGQRLPPLYQEIQCYEFALGKAPFTNWPVLCERVIADMMRTDTEEGAKGEWKICMKLGGADGIFGFPRPNHIYSMTRHDAGCCQEGYFETTNKC